MPRQPAVVSWFMLFAGVGLPLVCLAMGFPDHPRWQAGTYQSYAKLLLGRAATLPMWPCLLYAMSSMLLLFFRPERFAGHPVVRFGIFSGVLVAAEYWVLFQFADGSLEGLVGQVVAAAIVWGSAYGVVWGFSKLRPEHHDVAALLIPCLLVFPGMYVLPVFAFCSLFSSTLLALAAYLQVARVLLARGGEPQYRFGLRYLLGAMTWLAAHLACWRVSFGIMLEEYARLPVEAPDCFVCSAAAGGHPGLVRSAIVRWPDGAVSRVNNQIRYLKAFELLLAHAAPRLHTVCRRAYNRIGPPLAALVELPVLADAAYLALKPAEWLARGCLRLALPRSRRCLVLGLYSGAGSRLGA